MHCNAKTQNGRIWLPYLKTIDLMIMSQCLGCLLWILFSK